jgi:ATP-dependent DNA ligase
VYKAPSFFTELVTFHKVLSLLRSLLLIIYIPSFFFFFFRDLPSCALDGELWMGRGSFSKCSGIARRTIKDANEEWKEMVFQVFDAPSHKGVYEERVEFLKSKLKSSQYARVVGVQKCEGIDHLRKALAAVEELGGEGIMLRKPKSFYERGRSSILLKVTMSSIIPSLLTLPSFLVSRPAMRS